MEELASLFGARRRRRPRKWLPQSRSNAGRRRGRRFNARCRSWARDNGRTAEQTGFGFHTVDGERYWDERAYYAFTLDEIERQIEAHTAEIDAMCLELVGGAIDDDEYLRRLRIPEARTPHGRPGSPPA